MQCMTYSVCTVVSALLRLWTHLEAKFIGSGVANVCVCKFSCQFNSFARRGRTAQWRYQVWCTCLLVLLKSTKTKYKRMRGKLHCRGVFCNSPTVCRECTISLWILPRQFELHDKPWLKLSHFALMPDHVTALCTCHRRVWNTTQARYTSRNTRSLRGWQCKWPTSKQCTIVGCVKLQFVRPMTHFRCLLWVQRCMLPYCTLDRWEVDRMVGFCGSDVLFSSHVSLAKCVCVSLNIWDRKIGLYSLCTGTAGSSGTTTPPGS